ncbi:MAG: LiaF domain-containing protein, partial [Acidimicrobiales bacterium]
RRRLVGPVVFGVLLVWTGLAFLFDVSIQHGLAVGLLIIGVGFILGAFVGGSRVLIMPALVVGAALIVTGTVDIPLSGPMGKQLWEPERLADLEDAYEVSLGEGTIDLSAIEIPQDDRVQLDASVGMGHLVVLVPDGMTLDVTTDVGAGESDVLGRRQNGVGVTTDLRDEGDADSGTLVLDLQVGLGQIEVRRVGADPTETPGSTGSTPSTTSTTVLG